MVWKGLLVSLLVGSGCVADHSVVCSHYICPEDKACDEVHNGCVEPDQLKTCASLDNGMDCAIGSAPGLCHEHVCLPADCGDGFQRGDELCDGDELGAMPNCTDHGFYDSKPVHCNDACNYDTSMCTGFCGDKTINGAELCDGSPPTLSCVDLGYGAGFLDCNQCGPGLADCKRFGWRSEYLSLDQLTDIHGTSDTNIWAVGANSTVLRYDAQTGWKPVDLSACVAVPASIGLVGIWVFGDHDAMAIGNQTGHGVAIRITAMGCAVTTIASTAVGDIWGFAPDNVWVVGAGIHHFDGSSWSSTNTTDSFAGLWGSSPTDLYATGQAAAGGALFLHWTGAAWSPISGSPADASLGMITGRTPTDLWMQGIDLSSKRRFVRYTNGTWSTVPVSSDQTLALGTATGRVFQWTATGNVNSFDASNALTNIDQIPPTTTSRHALWGTPSGRLMAVSDSGRILSYEGQLLTSHSANLLTTLYGLTATADHALVSSGNEDAVWDGFSLGLDATVPTGIRPWLDPVNDDLYILQADGLYHRGRFAQSFPTTADVALSGGNAIFGRAANDLWLVGSGGSVVRHWNGSQLTCTTCMLTGVAYIAGSASNDMWAVGQGGTIQHWNGSAWTAQTSPTAADLSSVSASGPSDAWAAGLGGVFHFNGTAWSAVNIPGVSAMYTVWAFAPDDVFAGGPGGVLVHFDGTRWTPVKSPTETLIKEMIGVGDTLFIGDDESFLYRLIRTHDW